MSIAQRDLVCKAKGLYETKHGEYAFVKRGKYWAVFDLLSRLCISDGHSSLMDARDFLRRMNNEKKWI